MAQFPHLPLFTDAFLADTGHLDAQETGAYLLLIMIAWRSPGCRLPDDDVKLARWARLDMRTWKRMKPAIMGEFWTLTDGYWTQKRLSKEHEIVSKRAEVARDNGKRGGRPKSLENNETDNPAGSLRVSQKKAPIPIPIPIGSSLRSEQTSPDDASGTPARPSRKPKSGKGRPDYCGDFEMLWAEFPKNPNSSKSDAYAAWQNLSAEDRDACFEGAIAYAGWLKSQARPPPPCHLTTFINGRRFDTMLEAAE